MDSILPNPPQKQCRKCNQFFPITSEFFQRNRAMRDGFINYCKPCCSTAKPKEIIPEGYKRCSKCKELKPATNDFFYNHGKSRGELYSQCIECVCKEWREKHPTVKVNVPEGYKRCSHCQNVKSVNDFYLKAGGTHSWCKQCIHDYRKNREMIAPKAFKQCVKCHNEYPATPEFFYRTRSFIDGLESTCKVCQNAHLTLKRRPRQPEINRKQRERCAANREETNAEAKVRYHKRRALKKGNGGTYTAQDIQDQLKRQRHKCYYCQLKFEKTQKNEGIKYIYHIEHVVPLTRNGSNDMSNIVLACPTCNLRKHNRLPHEWPEGNRLL